MEDTNTTQEQPTQEQEQPTQEQEQPTQEQEQPTQEQEQPTQEQEQPTQEHPIRYYEVMNKVFAEMDTMDRDELKGATRIISILVDYFWDIHFNKRQVLDQKVFVKTLDEIRDNLFDAIYN
jgi:hypothetical protein